MGMLARAYGRHGCVAGLKVRRGIARKNRKTLGIASPTGASSDYVSGCMFSR